MFLARFVVAERLLELDFFEERIVNCFPFSQVLGNPFDLVQEESGVAVCLRNELLERFPGNFDVPELESAGMILEREPCEAGQVFGRKRRKQDELAAGKERGIDFKSRIFRRRADKRYRSVFDSLEESVLLALVESMDLVDEEDRATSQILVGLRFGKDRLDFLDAAFYGGERDKALFRVKSDDVREACLAAARRSPENHAGNVVAFDALAEHAVVA